MRQYIDGGNMGDIYYARAQALRRRGVPGWGVFIDKEQIHRTGMASAGPHHDRIVLGIMEEPFSTFLASFGGLQLQRFFTEQGSILTLPEEMRPYIQSLLQDIASELIHKKPGYLLAAMIEKRRTYTYFLKVGSSFVSAKWVSCNCYYIA